MTNFRDPPWVSPSKAAQKIWEAQGLVHIDTAFLPVFHTRPPTFLEGFSAASKLVTFIFYRILLIPLVFCRYAFSYQARCYTASMAQSSYRSDDCRKRSQGQGQA